MDPYHRLVNEIQSDFQRLRAEAGGGPCPSNCFSCCQNTATMAISEVEARDLKVGLERLPLQLRMHIGQKAERTVRELEANGYTAENIVPDAGMRAISVVKGTPEGECPMLIGGVCAVYERRPVICRVWGYPIHNGAELACCHKTFIGQRGRYQPLKYTHYWNECKRLSSELGAHKKTPNCYLVLRLLSE